MRIRLTEIAGQAVLASSRSGRAVLEKLLERVMNGSNESQVLYLDFVGVEVATASFLRESVLEFRDIVRRRWSNFYPVVANANESVVEELSVLVRSTKDVLILCQLDEKDQPRCSFTIGSIDAKQNQTFELVKQMKVASASKLKAEYRKENVSQNAWNNRLAGLCKLGLLIETNDGRSKCYRPLPLFGD